MLKKIIIFLLLTIILIVIGSAYYLYTLLQPVSLADTQKKTFIIPKGQAVMTIAERLQEEGLIKNALIFRLIVKQENLVDKIQAGSFELAPNMTAWQIAQLLTEGTNDVWLTIPEGWRREEIAASLIKYNLAEYNEEEFLDLTTGQEGYLFPDTYLVPKMIQTKTIVNLLLDTFDKKINQDLLIDQSFGNEKNQYCLADLLAGNPGFPSNADCHTLLDFNDILVMASIIEREARGYEEMRTVAGILYQRLEIGMALQADATLQYAKGYDQIQKTWWPVPSLADKKISSPFNTYLNPGLPPKPICNPGLEAIQASLQPKKTNYLYYLHDLEGQIHYAQSLEEHQQNINQYLH